MVNLGFDDNKTKFETNDHISSVTKQDDFQSGNHKDKIKPEKINRKKKKTIKESAF